MRAKRKQQTEVIPPPGRAVAHRDPRQTPVAAPRKPPPDNMLAIIANAARDPSVDPAKMRELLSIRSELKREEALEAFNRAFIAVQKELPTISKRGLIKVPAKDGKTGHQTPYARFEDINRVVKPILQKHDLGVSFRTDAAADGKVSVTAILRHKLGHQEESCMVLPLDSTGSKNNAQAAGSSISYGKRHTMLAILNIIAEGEDDDAHGGAEAVISEAQLVELIEAIETAGLDKRRFCEAYEVDGVAKLPAVKFDTALARVKQAGKKK